MGTSNDGTVQISKKESNKSYNTWYDYYKKARQYDKNSVQSNLIWSSQFNAMLNWFIKEGVDVYNKVENGAEEIKNVKNFVNVWTMGSEDGYYNRYYTVSWESKPEYMNATSSTTGQSCGRATLYIK